MRIARSPVVAAILALALVACSDSTSSVNDLNPAGARPSALVGNNGNGFGNHEPISLVASAPALETASLQFWAVQGKPRSVLIRYLPKPGEKEGKVFLRFTIPAKASLVDPDGRRLARGDSLLISVIPVPGKLEAELLPHGLVFADGVPAQLDISFYYGDTRGRPTDQLGTWYFPPDGSQPEPVYSVVNARGWMVQGQIEHFSNYAVAY